MNQEATIDFRSAGEKSFEKGGEVIPNACGDSPSNHSAGTGGISPPAISIVGRSLPEILVSLLRPRRSRPET
jgi:hypothetical protein